MSKKNHLHVEYIESGTFCGSEELCYDVGIKTDDICVVVKEARYNTLTRKEKQYNKIMKAILSNRDYLDVGRAVMNIMEGDPIKRK